MADEFESLLGEVKSGVFKPENEPERPTEMEQDPIFTDLLQKEQTRVQEQNFVTAMRASRANPDQYPETKELAGTFGLPVDVVDRNRDRLKAFKGIQDAQQLFRQDPVLGKFYAEGDNAEAIKIDELRRFSGMNWLTLAAVHAFVQGREDVNLGNARYEELMGRATGEQIDAADKLSRGREPRTFGADSWLEKGWAGTWQQIPNMIETLLGGVDSGIKGAIGGASIAAVAGQLGPQVAAPEEILTIPAGAAAGYKVGAISGQLQTSFRLQAGLAYDEFKNLRDQDGRPMDPDVAKGAAMLSGATGALLETIGFQAMAKVVPGLDKVAGHLTVDGVKSAIMRPTVAAALKNFAQNVVKSGATEVSTEVMQEAIQVFAGEMAKSMSNDEGANFLMMTGDQVAERIGDTFEQTMQTMTILGPAFAGTRLGHDIRRARQSANDLAVVDAINQHAQGNELNARLPEKAKEIIKAVTENGPVKNFYVDPAAFSTFFQTSEEIGAYTAQIGLTEEYNEASRLGRDMEIPVEVYYSSIAGTEIGLGIRDFVKLDPDHMNGNEAAAFNEAWAEAAQEIASQAEADYLATQQAVTAVEQIHEDVKARAMNAGIIPDQAEQYAKLYSTFFRVMGDRTMQDPGELYRKYGFEIRRAVPGWDNEYRPVDGLNISLEAIRKGAIDPLRKKIQKSKGSSLLEAIKARGGIEDAGGDLATLTLPKGIIRKSSKGQGSMIVGGENQFSADDVARQMWEEGYFPEFEDRPTANDLLDAIAEEAAGNPRYKVQVTQDPAVDRAEALVSFADELDRLGLDPNRMTDDEIRAELEAIIADDPNTGALYQAAVPNMIVQHNLSVRNLLHADKMRGLAVPSVAISNVDAPLTNFGEITLLGDVDLVDPKKDSSSKVFNADVYSPRYPTVRYKLVSKELNKAWKVLGPASQDLGNVLSGELDNSEVERQGLEAFRNSSAVQLHYLRETGQEVELPMMAARTSYLVTNPEIANVLNEYDTPYEVIQKPEAVEAISAAIDVEIAKNIEARGDAAEEAIRGWYYDKSGEIKSSVIRQIQEEMRIAKRPGVDRSAARQILRDAVSSQADQFSDWVTEQFGTVISGETIETQTASGTWKYLPHTLDNVVKVLRQKLRDGEGFNYGVGSIRSNVARQFKNVAAIKAARGDLIPHEAMQALKDEVDNEFLALANRFQEYMPSQRGIGFMDTFSEHLKEVASRGVTVLDRYYTDLPDGMKQEAAAFLDKLTNMPTEYFEAKLQRAVDLSEFKAAVIPSDTPKAARDVLTYARVPVFEYDATVEGARAEAIKAASNQQRILFQSDARTSQAATDSEAFKSWFGDSKIVDDAGKPLVVYHGTQGDFDAFADGFAWVTPDQELADDYSDMGGFNGRPEGKARVISAYARIERPFNTDFGLPSVLTFREFAVGAMEQAAEQGRLTPEMADAVQALIAEVEEQNAEAQEKHQFWNGGWSQYTRRLLETLDFDGMEFLEESSRFDDQRVRTFAVLNSSQIKDVNNRGTFDANDPRILFQEGTQAGETGGVKRGSIQFGEGRTIINMFEAANPSTFLHESGHFFLEVFRDLAVAQQGQATTVTQDWQTVRDFLGITDDANISVDAHEKFARSFEAYLFEGKAPSNEVAGIFSRFRSWLVFVYQSVANLNAPINDKVRAVMDRLVATDEEIRVAQSGADFRPMFSSAEEAGMTPSQWKDYVEVAGRAVERAKRDLTARMLQDVKRETTAEWREAKREIRAEVTAELERTPVYQVINYLRTGQSSMLPGGMERVYLDRESILDIMGEGALLKMPKSVPPLYRASGGVHADILAEMFGYSSGHEMLTNIMSARPMSRAIVEETNARMRQRFGDLMGDAVARAREASAAIDNDATGELLMKEMEVLMRKGLVTTTIRKQDAQRFAREAVRGKTIREAVRVKLYQNANLRAAQDVERAIMKGDWKAAVSAKQRQVLNHFMAVEAREAEKDAEAAVRYLNKFTGRKRPKGIDVDYLDQIEGILERFDLRKSVSLKDAQRRNSLAAWIQEQEAQGNIVDVPDVLRRDAFRKPYREMTVDDLLAVRDAVKNIEHLGRLKDKLLSNKEQREFLGARDELLASLAISQERRKDPKTRNPTPLALAWEQAQSLEATQLKMEQVFDWMDNGDVNGPFNRYIWRPIANAEARENEMRAKYAAKIAMIFEKLDKDRLNTWITIPGVKQTFKRSEIMAIALNMGNASNLDKMLRGEGWTNDIVDRAVSNLNDAEWAAVQEVWDTINELWPEISALQRRLAGVVPPKVEAREFVTPSGKKMKGGYYPVIYDPRRSADVEDRAAAAADLFIENTYLRPDTLRGFTKERAQMYARPILYDLDAIGNHINGVIHDLTHREPIMDAVKFLTNGEVRAEIEGRYGKAVYQQMMPWLQSIARDMPPNEGLNAVNRAFRSVRSRATMVAMGFRVSTMLAQISGLSSSAEMVPVKHLAGAIKDFMRNPAAMWNEVDELSGEMRFRMETLDRDIKERLRELTGATTALDRARRFAFYGIGYLDRVVTVPTWMAAYRDHLSKYPTDKEGAAAHADKVVRLTQGSGGAKDLSALQRRNELTKLITMFYSYFAAYYNRQRAWGRDAKKAVMSGNVREFPQLLARQVFMTIGPALLGEMLVGKGPEDDEDWEKWALRKVALYPVSAVPVVRDFANYFNTGFDYSFTPLERTLNDAVIRPLELVGDVVEGDGDARKATKVLINGAGLWFNLPTGQLATSVDNVWKAIEEDDFQLRDIVLTRPSK